MTQKLLKQLDPGLLITLALCSFALWPLLYRPGLPNGDDVLYHVFRAAEMDRTWSHGVLFPRWAETFYTGYGAPVFHYYASLTYYLTSILARLGLDAVNGLRALIALGTWMGAAGMYGFTRAYAGKAGGIIAALCYAYSPYILYTEPYSRGAYPEMMAFALFPLVMWSFSRLLRRGGAWAFTLSAVGLGSLIITHNLMALVLTGLLAAWIVSCQLSVVSSQFLAFKPSPPDPLSLKARGNRKEHFWKGLFGLLAVGVGVGLAAYFWLPVVSEGNAAHLNNLTGFAGVSELDYRRFFVPLNHLLAHSPRMDAGALNGLEHQLNLGVAQWTLAISGGLLVIGYWFLVSRRQLPVANGQSLGTQYSVLSTILFFGLAGAACVFLISPGAGRVWELISPLAFLQFPWRLLGPAAFCLAVLAGMNAVWIGQLPVRMSGLIYAGLVVGIIGLASPLMYVTEWKHETVDTSVAAYHDAELKGLQRATTFSNEYLPSAVVVEPGATPRLLADYADGYPVNKAHLETLPEGVTVELLEHGPQHDVWRVNAPSDFTLEVLTYDFAGWAAEVDGQHVPITASNPHGLITLPVPAGEHTVRVFMGSTPARDLGNGISAVAVLSVIGYWFLVFRRQLPVASYEPSALNTEVEIKQELPVRYFVLGGVVMLGFLGVYLREGGAWVNSPPGEARLAQHQTAYQLGENIRLIGYDLNGETFRPGDRVEVRVYWYTTGAISYGYSSFVHISTGGPPAGQADKLNPAGLPTKTWESGGFIRDDYVIELPHEMAAGTYSVYVGLYTCDTRPLGECGNGERLMVTDGSGVVVGDAVLLAQLKVER